MSKKFILFLLEGQNDKKVIDTIIHTRPFNAILDKYVPGYIILNGDLTSNSDSNEHNIIDKISKKIIEYRKKQGPYPNIKVQDIQGIIHIVDLDGAFITNDSIQRGEESELLYTDNTIITSNVDGVIGRNKKKAKLIRRLIETTQIGNIPYSIYYVSCNMDHYLFNERNLGAKQKRDRVDQFILLSTNAPESILNMINDDTCSAKTSYYESWNSIMNGTESLKRRTNLNLFFTDNAKISSSK